MGALFNGNSWVTSLTDYVRTPTDHTVVYWLRLDDDSVVRRPFGHTGAWEARTLGNGTGTLVNDYLQAGTGAQIVIPIGEWAHVGFCQDVTNGRRITYLNGQVASTVESATFSTATQSAPLSVGVTAGGSSQGWFGGIDDIRVYDRVMEQPEIQTIHACHGTDGIKRNLTLWYQLDRGVDGAVIAAPILNRAENQTPILTEVTGIPTYDYSAGIKHKRRQLG